MNMKNPVFKRGLIGLALMALVGASGIAVWAGDKAKERAPLELKTDSKFVDRDSNLRVSYASVVKQAAPSVVYVFSS